MEIKASVRMNPLGYLELFYIDEHKDLCCFSFQEGHNIACKEYMYKCKPVDKVTATMFLTKYNCSYIDDVTLILTTRLHYK